MFNANKYGLFFAVPFLPMTTKKDIFLSFSRKQSFSLFAQHLKASSFILFSHWLLASDAYRHHSQYYCSQYIFFVHRSFVERIKSCDVRSARKTKKKHPTYKKIIIVLFKWLHIFHDKKLNVDMIQKKMRNNPSCAMARIRIANQEKKSFPFRDWYMLDGMISLIQLWKIVTLFSHNFFMRQSLSMNDILLWL